MGMARYLVEAHLLEGRPVAELAASHGVHRSWIYKLLARYRSQGDEGLAPRSRRPRHSPTRTSQAFISETEPLAVLIARAHRLGIDPATSNRQRVSHHPPRGRLLLTLWEATANRTVRERV